LGGGQQIPGGEGKEEEMIVEFYKDKKGRWRWRAIAGNGRIVADCAQGNGYKSLRGAKKGLSAARTVLAFNREAVIQ
jgi:uncharacterized protein YegP (UPF0339 family)